MEGTIRIGRGILLSFLVFFGIHTLYAEVPGNASISVIQKEDGKPLPDAIIKIIPLDTVNIQAKRHLGFTNMKGKFIYTFTEPVVVEISHLGFQSITDTIYGVQNKLYTISYTSQDIKDVVVTGQYAPTSVQNSVYRVKVISPEMLKEKGANNLSEALQNELHIDLGQDQVFGSTMSINGISGEGIKVMVDGVPIVGRMDGKLDLSQINVSNIERIEIVEGPLSVLYGTDAMGGVVNIITKNYQSKKISLDLKGYYETVGQYNVELNAGFGFKRNQIFLSAGRHFFDGYTTLDSIPRYMEWKPKEQYFADAKYQYNGNRLQLAVTGSFFRELMLNRSAPRQTLLYSDGDTSWTYVGDDVKYLTYRPRAAVFFTYRFRDDYRLDVLASYSGYWSYINKYIKNLVTDQEQVVNDPEVQDTARYQQALFRATYSMPAWQNRINFLMGIETNQEFTRQTHIIGGAQRGSGYAAFGSARLSLVKGLDIQPAIRILYNSNFSTQRTSSGQKHFNVPLIPSLNIKYGYKDKFVLRASYGRGYRAPSLKELYMTFFDLNHAIKGNPDLIPEDGHTVNLSFNGYIHRNKHQVEISTSGFYNNISNKIDFAIFNAPFPPDTYQYYNMKKYITYGGSVGVNYTWDRLQLGASALITRYELNNTRNVSDKVKTYSPDFVATASYTIPKAEIGVHLYYKYDGIKPLFSITSSIQAGYRAAFHMLNLSLSRSFWHDRIQIVVGGKNLVGVKNVVTQGVEAVGHNFNPDAANVAWGRTFFTTLILHFSK